jgi:arsenate reductase
MLTVYGIPNCDTIKKTQKWLEKEGLSYRLHNYRQEGITREKIEQWLTQVHLSKLLNKASTTFKGLSEEEKASVSEQGQAVDLMLAHPTMIKRPVVEDKEGRVLSVGFKEADFVDLFRA